MGKFGFSDQMLSGVFLSIHVSHFHLPLQTYLTNFNQTLQNVYLGGRMFKFENAFILL